MNASSNAAEVKPLRKDLHEAINKAELNWQVEKRPLFDEKGKKLPIFGTFRSDNDFFLGTVGSNYRIIQNQEIISVAQDLEKSGLEVKFTKGGAIDNGARVYFSFDVPALKMDIGKIGDYVSISLVLSAKHDGMGSLFASLKGKRLICTNGMTVSKEQNFGIVRHTASAGDKIDEVKSLMNNAATATNNYSNLMNQLVRVKVDNHFLQLALEKVFYKDESSNLYTSPQKQNVAREVLELFEKNDGDAFKGQRGTAYNLFNAFTNYTDHFMGVRIKDNETEAQAKDRTLLFGSGEVLKQKALFEIVNLARGRASANITDEMLSNIL